MNKSQSLFSIYLMVLSLITPSPVKAAQTVDDYLTIGQNTIHYGVFEGGNDRVGDVFYFHGFGDRMENHKHLFQEWNRAGFRVISFDLPSHGESEGTLIGGLDFHSFESLSEIAATVLKQVRAAEDDSPLLFAGWSLGGLLATRILQIETLRNEFPKVSGLMLYAPAFAPQKCVGSLTCQVTNETLSHDESVKDRVIKPLSPLLHLPFAARLFLQSTLSWHPPLPSDLQTLILVASENDKYVHTSLVKKWVGTHRSNYVSRISAYQCPDARHELDNEPSAYGGDFVRRISKDFASTVAQGEHWQDVQKLYFPFQPCLAF